MRFNCKHMHSHECCYFVLFCFVSFFVVVVVVVFLLLLFFALFFSNGKLIDLLYIS